jgi:hypothetical protein
MYNQPLKSPAFSQLAHTYGNTLSSIEPI